MLVAVCVCIQAAWFNPALKAGSLTEVIVDVQPKMVKVYGAGGFRGLEPYQSGVLISAEGHILTVWSYVLDTDVITITLSDGRRYNAELVGADPRLEVAVLKIEAERLPYFEFQDAATAGSGTRVLAFSNLYGVATGNEPCSVQHGVVSVKTTLEARRGVFDTPYRGPVYVLDAVTNNPGAGGGALTNRQGELIGLLGKELRNSLNNTWLNYSIPVEELSTTVEEIRSGRFTDVPLVDPTAKPDEGHSPELFGMILVPDVVERTPPFIDNVRRDSVAYEVGLRPDDLILFVNDRLVQSCKALRHELEFIDRSEQVKLTVIRDQQLVDVILGVEPVNP
jgi:serine protease Do